MRNKKRISIKSPYLNNLRFGLRRVICEKTFEELKKLRELSYNHESIDNRYNSSAGELRSALKRSICVCGYCSDYTADMIYLAEETNGCKPGWYCPRDYDFAVNLFKYEKYEINPFLDVVLKKYDVRTYIRGKKFLSCMLLKIDIPAPQYTSETADSIDELVEKYYYTTDGQKTRLNEEFFPIHTQFFAHCSNIQAWYECGYDTRLLHRNIAFPLLKELTLAGDRQAKKVFKEEIAKRYRDGSSTVREYLKVEGYLKFLSKEEKESIGITFNS